MPERAETSPALKEIFNRARLEHIAAEALAVFPGFRAEAFLAAATQNLEALGIMERMRQTARALDAGLPGPYRRNLGILSGLAPRIGHSFAAIALCEYAALFGRDDFDASMAALKDFTRYGSAEFAVRVFLRGDFDRTLAVMTGWAADGDEHVRRLASEGSRPRLPWSFHLAPLLADPSPTRPILSALKADPSPYVRRSVANHLNDISKDNPRWLLDEVGGWGVGDPGTAGIVRHALRSLVKKGEPRALALLGADHRAEVRAGDFSVSPAVLRLGDVLTLSARLVSTGTAPQRLVVDYAIHYVKQAGRTYRKVFKLRTLDLAPGAEVAVATRQTIRDFSTRRHHAGRHRVELIVNGATLAEGAFELRA